MMDKIKDWLGIAKPGGIDDVAIRAVKTALVTFAAFMLRDGLGHADASVYKAALDAAWVGGGTVILNALLLLAPGEAGQKTGGDEDVDEDA